METCFTLLIVSDGVKVKVFCFSSVLFQVETWDVIYFHGPIKNRRTDDDTLPSLSIDSDQTTSAPSSVNRCNINIFSFKTLKN